MTRKPGQALYGRQSRAMGASDPRGSHRNAQADAAPDILLSPPLTIDARQRLALKALAPVAELADDATTAEVITAFNSLVRSLKNAGYMRK